MSTPQDFPIELVWRAIQEQLKADLSQDLDVDSIGEKDFDEEGMLTLRLPAARVLFLGAEATPVESQNVTYRQTHRYGVMCADESDDQDPQTQRDKSLHVAQRVARSLTGARLVLGNGQTSDPVRYAATDPWPTRNAGMAYVVAFLIEGTSSFPAPHRVPAAPEQGENNG